MVFWRSYAASEENCDFRGKTVQCTCFHHLFLQGSGFVGDGGTTTAQGRPAVLSARTVRGLCRAVAQRNVAGLPVTTRLLASDLNLSVSLNTIRRALQLQPHIRLMRPRRAFVNFERQRTARLAWARDHIDVDFNGVFFFDEQRLTLDGSDRPSFQLTNTNVGLRPFVRRVVGGGSVFLLLLFGPEGLHDVLIENGFVNADDVMDVLTRALPAHARLMMDNATTHNLAFSRIPNSFRQPPYSPDLQPVENVFSAIRRQLYAGNRQFYSKGALVAELQKIVDKIIKDKSDVRWYANIVRSMKRRMERVIEEKGGLID